jgi:hypothetical protein
MKEGEKIKNKRKNILLFHNYITFQILNILPHEDISLISGYLKFHPRLNLASKCRQVYNVVFTTTIYEDFELLARYLGSVMKVTLTTHFDDRCYPPKLELHV